MISQAVPPVDIITILADASGPLFMAIVIWGAISEWWVPGRTHRRMVAERDELLKLALHGTRTAERSVRVAETITEAANNK
jgi:hypothetical protein